MTEAPAFALLAKQDTWSCHAVELARIIFGETLVVAQGVVGDALPPALESRRFRALLSFLSPWIVPKELLDRADLALNFHPGSHEYPGNGCYNFALYEDAPTYGAVCHHMEATVDTGAIVSEQTFPVAPDESVESLKYRTMVTLLAQFHDIAWLVSRGRELPRADLAWSRPAFRLRDLDELRRITPNMPADEVRRRQRAVTYPGYPGVLIDLGGVELASSVPQRKPLA